MRFQQDRSFYIPKTGATEIVDAAAQSVVYTYERVGVPYAMGFAGKAQKPTFHFRFRNDERRAAHIAEFFKGQRDRLGRKLEAQAKRRAFVHSLKVGDVLRSSWGYEQTNVDYYQVVALKGAKQVIARRIHGMSEVTGWEQGKCAPDVGNFIEREPEKTYLVQEGNVIRVASYACAYPVHFKQVGGLKVYESSFWSSYA